MPDQQPFTSPVEDSVPKQGEIAVGENLEFQRKWWKFERAIWIFFLFLLIADVLGLFGRGWLAKAAAQTPGGSLTIDYERIERAGTPSVITLAFHKGSIQNGKIRVFVSDSVVRPLGAQRIAPQPESSTLGNGGITYTFPATEPPAVIQIALEPSFPGLHTFRIQPIGDGPIDGKVFVMP